VMCLLYILNMRQTLQSWQRKQSEQGVTMQPDTRVRVKSTGEIGYVVKEDEDGMLCIRIPSDNNWPFPHYAFISKRDVVMVRVAKSAAPLDIEEAPF